MITKLYTRNGKTYYRVEGAEPRLIKVYHWESEPKTEAEIYKAFCDAELPSYLSDEQKIEYLVNPLAIFQLSIYPTWARLEPQNMSIWEYEYFIKGNTAANYGLNCACIQQSHEDNTFYIPCESNDNKSMTNTKNLKAVYEWVHLYTKELQQRINKVFSHVEVY